jgi:hypothetical protein
MVWWCLFRRDKRFCIHLGGESTWCSFRRRASGLFKSGRAMALYSFKKEQASYQFRLLSGQNMVGVVWGGMAFNSKGFTTSFSYNCTT